MPKISDSIDLFSLEGLQLKSLWVLEKISNSTEDRFSATKISNYLIETCGVNTSRQAVKYALEKEKGLVNKNKYGYKIMKLGEKKLASSSDKNKIIFIESGKPFLAKHVKLKNLFSTLGQQIFISDPYIDAMTLDVIFDNIDKNNKIKILTQKLNDKPKGSFGRKVSDLRKEGYQIEIAIYSKSDMHDRYIMDNKNFWLSGNSLNYLGNKESFIIKLQGDVHQSMMVLFNNRWKVSQKI